MRAGLVGSVLYAAVALAPAFAAAPASQPESRAQPFEFLAPHGTVSPDGFEAAVRWAAAGPAPSLELKADGADVVATSATGVAKIFRVVPLPARQTITLTAKAGESTLTRSLSVGPPGQGVSLQLEPAAPVKNRDATALLTIELRNARGEPDSESAPPVLRANVGRIDGLKKAGPGVYRATYVLPTTRYPEVAVVVAFSAWPHPQSVHGSFGALRVPLAAAVDLPGNTEANADMSISIAGTTFGPVRAAADGRFKLPVVVPPGYGKGTGVAVDRLGNRRTVPVDLMLPPTDQLACVVSPTQLPTDATARARVLCATSDPFGNIATGAKVGLTAKRGKLSAPRPGDNGVTEWVYQPPADGNFVGADQLLASWRQGGTNAKEELEIALTAGPAAAVRLSPHEPQVHQGAALPLQIAVFDRHGRPRDGAAVALASGEGALEATAIVDAGVLTARWRAPSSGDPRASTFAIRSFGPVGSEPARIVAWAEAKTLLVAVTDLAGRPVPAQKLLWSSGSAVTDEQGVASIGPAADGDLVVRHAEWPGVQLELFVRDQGRFVFPTAERPSTAPTPVQVELLPAVPVIVRLVVHGHDVTWWLESNDGEVIEGRPVEVSLSGGVASAPSTTNGRTRFTVSGVANPITVSVTDLRSQVTALGEVTP